MNYFQPYSLSSDQTIVAAWDSQIAEAAEMPWLAQTLTAQSSELFPHFAACYAQLCALPRGARRALQRQLPCSRDVAAILLTWRRKLATSLAGAALLLAQGAQAAITGIPTQTGSFNLIFRVTDPAGGSVQKLLPPTIN
jgi:hypothetical protein